MVYHIFTNEHYHNIMSMKLSVCLAKKPAYFTIKLIFATIHKSNYTFYYYSWVLLYYLN